MLVITIIAIVTGLTSAFLDGVFLHWLVARKAALQMLGFSNSKNDNGKID